jgi:hypothetical protein
MNFFRITDEENRNLYTYMERLDQGHLYPLLEEGPRLTCPGQESNPGLRGGRRALIFNIHCFFTCHFVAKLPAPHMWGESIQKILAATNSYLCFVLHIVLFSFPGTVAS